MKVTVVGAGLAGLATAYRLMQSGVDVEVLEANDRVGGRCRSAVLRNGVSVERGGEFIDPEQHTIRAFCAELELPLIPHGVNFYRRRQPDGSTSSTGEITRAMAALADAARDLEQDVSARELFSVVIGSGPHPILDRLETSSAADVDHLSARFVFAGFTPPQIDHGSRVRGGNARIAREMGVRLGPRIRLDAPVEAVRSDSAGITVWTRDGTEVRSDALVLAVPLPLLGRIDWGDGLPQEWAAGVEQLGFGDAAKLSVGTRGQAAPQAIAGAGRRWWSWNSATPDDHLLGVPAVTCFAGTPEQVTELDVESGSASWLRSLRDARFDLELDEDDHLVTVWRHEPWAQGAYSFAKVGWEPAPAELLQQASDRVVLAGEHTAGRWAGTMNGALMSGERAARVVGALG